MWHRKSLGSAAGAHASAVCANAVPFAQCPAKTWLTPQGATLPGRSVPEHCHIVGAVAQQQFSI